MSDAWELLAKPVAVLRSRAHENWSRALVKTLGYRVVMICITIAVAFLVTRQVGSALEIGLVTNAIKTGTYFAYERLWARISWGTTFGE